MTRFFRWSLSTYRRLLIFYPDDLRRDFGAEMLDAFSHDLAAARNLRGAIRVWRVTLHELIRIALPAWLENPAVAVPLLSAAAVIVSQLPLLIMTVRRQAQLSSRPGDPTPLSALLAIAILAAITALTSFVAVHRRKRTSIVSLNIG